MKLFRLTLFLHLLFNFACSEQPECTLDGIRFFIPNVINYGDITNNVFYPRSTFEELVVESLSVFSNSGLRVFHNEQFPLNDPEHGWDGTINGRVAAVGTYNYYIEISDGEELACHAGDFTLIK